MLDEFRFQPMRGEFLDAEAAGEKPPVVADGLGDDHQGVLQCGLLEEHLFSSSTTERPRRRPAKTMT
jgi:hypothetical protein